VKAPKTSGFQQPHDAIVRGPHGAFQIVARTDQKFSVVDADLDVRPRPVLKECSTIDAARREAMRLANGGVVKS